ncbi:unnamed protein product, partial [Iphiclides podalirius]
MEQYTNDRIRYSFRLAGNSLNSTGTHRKLAQRRLRPPTAQQLLIKRRVAAQLPRDRHCARTRCTPVD